jgi:hypothetical protein
MMSAQRMISLGDLGHRFDRKNFEQVAKLPGRWESNAQLEDLLG